MRIVATARYIDAEVTMDSVSQNPTGGTHSAFQSNYVSSSEEVRVPPARDTHLLYPNSIIDLRNLGILSLPDSEIAADHTVPTKYKINGVNNPFSLPVSHTNTVWFEVSDERSVCNFLPYRQ